MFAASQLVGCRPEMLKGIANKIALELDETVSLGELFKRGAQGFCDHIWDEIESDYNALMEVQRVMLAVLIERRQGHSSSSENSMKTYVTKLGYNEFFTATVQAVLDTLRDKSLIRRGSRGAYVLEDESLALWLRGTHGACAVPSKLSE